MDASRRAIPIPKEVQLPGPEPETPLPTDEELLESTRRGDRSAFETLYRRHAGRMKSIACNLLGSASDAEDAVQETFLKVFRGAAAFRGTARFSTWIYRILLNACHDAGRRRRRRPEREDSPDVSSARLDLPAPGGDHRLRLELEESVARLPERPRAVFLLSAVEGFTHLEIGEILGIPEGTSRTLLFEARRELQRLLWPGRPEARA